MKEIKLVVNDDRRIIKLEIHCDHIYLNHYGDRTNYIL